MGLHPFACILAFFAYADDTLCSKRSHTMWVHAKKKRNKPTNKKRNKQKEKHAKEKLGKDVKRRQTNM